MRAPNLIESRPLACANCPNRLVGQDQVLVGDSFDRAFNLSLENLVGIFMGLLSHAQNNCKAIGKGAMHLCGNALLTLAKQMPSLSMPDKHKGGARFSQHQSGDFACKSSLPRLVEILRANGDRRPPGHLGSGVNRSKGHRKPYR